MFGCGNTLRKLGRAAEALKFYEALVPLQTEIAAGSGFVNFHCHLPELWLRAHGPAKTLALAKK